MNTLSVHQVAVPDGYLPNPSAHLSNPRDGRHFEWLSNVCRKYSPNTLLDIGPWDGWLALGLLEHRAIKRAYGVELVQGLAAASMRYARAHNLDWWCWSGYWDQYPTQDGHFADIVLAAEVLEHMPLADVPEAVHRMEQASRKMIMISLPDQAHELNPQHLWTPTWDRIMSMWRTKRNFCCHRFEYPGTQIPASFLIKWEIAWRPRPPRSRSSSPAGGGPRFYVTPFRPYATGLPPKATRSTSGIMVVKQIPEPIYVRL